MTAARQKSYAQRPGVGVDSSGGQVIDPTKNVEDLVKALRETLQEFRTGDQRYLDAQFGWSEKVQNFALEAEVRLRDQLRMADEKLAQAETRRIDQLALTSERFETTIRNMLAESVRTTSDLVSNQLVQIQATFNERVSKLEAGAFTQAGKNSVADPALAQALAEMAASIQGLTRSETRTDTRRETWGSMGAAVLGASFVISTLIAVAGFVIARAH
jgi:hypothetical protein